MGDKLTNFLLAVCVVAVIVGLYADYKQTEECKDRGGIPYHYKCFAKEALK